MDRHCSTVSAGEELFFSEGDCFWAAVVCCVQVEQVLGGGTIVSSLLRREGWREGEGRSGGREGEEHGGGRYSGKEMCVCVCGGGGGGGGVGE